MAKPVRGHALEEHVVLDIGCGDDGRTRSRITEQRILERCQPRQVNVLDNLHDSKRVEVAQAAIPIGECTLPEIDTRALAWRHLVEAQPECGRLERSPGSSVRVEQRFNA